MRKKENFLTFQSLFHLLWKVHRRHFLLLFSIVFIILLSLSNFFLKNNLRGNDIIFIQKKNSQLDTQLYGEILDALNIYVSSGLIFQDLKKYNSYKLPNIETQSWEFNKLHKTTALIKLQVTHNFISEKEYKNFNNTLLANLNKVIISNIKMQKNILANNCKNSHEELLFLLFSFKDLNSNLIKKINLQNNFALFFLSDTRKYDNEVGKKYLYDLNLLAEYFTSNNSLFLGSDFLNRFIISLDSSRKCLTNLILFNNLDNDEIFEIILPDSDNKLRSSDLDLLSTFIISFIFTLFAFYAYFFLYKSKN